MNATDPRALRDAFGAFMTGVTVVTAWDANGAPIGFTANSFTSVSLDPPLVLVCIAHTSRNHDALVAGHGFAVNILSESQKDVSNAFARPVEDRFAAVTWQRGPFGAPILDGVSAWFDCAMHRTVEGGDHTILIGRVEAFENRASPGLGYARGAYVTPTTEAATLQRGTGTTGLVVSALIEQSGAVLLVPDRVGNLTIPTIAVDDRSVAAAMETLLQSLDVQAEPGFVFSVFEDEAGAQRHICFLCQTAASVRPDTRFRQLDPDCLAAIQNPAIRAMLTRFAAENSLGQFGFYFGNQTTGTVRPIRSRR
jgi:flavin reductase (DIM6/NTAB) family NADH-FMN oxidoreductase RutF